MLVAHILKAYTPAAVVVGDMPAPLQLTLCMLGIWVAAQSSAYLLLKSHSQAAAATATAR